MRKLITLTGPSQAGKSTTIDLFKKYHTDMYCPVSIPKYTTRDGREDDSEDEVILCKKIPEACNLIYQQYDSRYGINSKTLTDSLNQGETPIVVINDVRTISEIKRIFGNIVTSVFVYREAPDLQKHLEIAKQRQVKDLSSIEKRLKKAEAIYRIYIENIYLFNHVIINNRSKTELEMQIKSIVELYKEDFTRKVLK